MKKICFFLSDIHGTGGISRVTWILANQLDSEFEVSVLACSNNKNKKYEYKETIKTGYLFDDLKPAHSRFFSIVKRLHTYIKNNNIDTIICAGVLLFPMCSIAVRGTKCKFICWEHSNTSVVNEFRFQKWCRLFGAKTADSIITLTRTDMKLYQEKYKVNNCTYMYNPVDDRLVQDINYNVNSKKIISVGRLCYQKNFELLVDIAEKVLKKHKDWTWDIYGEGEERPKLEEKICSLGLNERLTLKGNVNDLYQRYKEYSFLVMTSRFEGFPMTLLESTASGIPSVAFDILTGPNEIIIDGKSGFLIKPEDINEMVEKIEVLISNPELRREMSTRNEHERIKYECQTIVDGWIKYLQEN